MEMIVSSCMWLIAFLFVYSGGSLVSGTRGLAELRHAQCTSLSVQLTSCQFFFDRPAAVSGTPLVVLHVSTSQRHVYDLIIIIASVSVIQIEIAATLKAQANQMIFEFLYLLYLCYMLSPLHGSLAVLEMGRWKGLGAN
jgi:hypothetical protein